MGGWTTTIQLCDRLLQCFVVHAGECSSSTMIEHGRRGVLCVWLLRGRYVTDAGGFSDHSTVWRLMLLLSVYARAADQLLNPNRDKSLA